MAGTCYTFTISQLDIDSASGNTNPSFDNVVYASYLDANGTSQFTPYTVAGTYVVCVQVFSYFQRQQDNTCTTSTGGGVGCVLGTFTSTESNLFTVCTSDGSCLISPTPTTTLTPTPTEPYDIYLFEECGNSSNQFRYEYVPGSLNVGDVYLITNGVGFNGYAQVIV